MAHTILGIDLGTHSIKLAQLQAGFRTVRLLALDERPLLDPLLEGETAGDGPPPPEGPAVVSSSAESPPVRLKEESLLDRQMRTLQQMATEMGLHPEMVAVALAEDLTLRVVTLPLSDPKKLEQVLPFELEGQLLSELEEQIIDHTVAQSGIAHEEGQQGPGNGSRLLAAAAPREKVRDLIARLDRLGLEPRLCGAAALSCAALFAAADRGPKGAEADATPEMPLAILDLGHMNTHFCVVNGSAEKKDLAATFARSIGRGGFHLSAAIARTLSIAFSAAERLKHQVGHVAPSVLPVPELSKLQLPGAGIAAPDPATGASQAVRVNLALRDALRSLVRDLRQTLASYSAVYGQMPRRILLTGGGARLSGLAELLQEELSLPVAVLQVDQLGGAPWLGEGAAELPVTVARGEGFPTFTAALGLALSVAVPAPQVNFRKGELSYRTDYSFLREKAPHLMAAAMAILLCAGVSAVASLRGLQRESDQLAALLRSETTALFGEPRTDGEAVSAELNSALQSAKGGGQSVPTTSAFDLLDEISRAAPAGPLDVFELSIRPKVTELKATASSAQYVDDLVLALGKIACFKQVDKGKVVSVKNTGADGKPVDAKQFSLTITTTCP